MKFTLTATRLTFAVDSGSIKLFKSLGFKFSEPRKDPYRENHYTVSTSPIEIEINNLDDLKRLNERVENELVFHEDVLEIYNGYRE